MAKNISFIHAADLHLDSPFKGLQHTPEHIFQEIKESTFLALEKLVSVAITKKVNFVLLVGDLFDNEKQSLKAQIKLRRAFEELNQHGIEVYLSYGNHDFINGNIHKVTYPENVHIFPNEIVSHFTFQKDGEALANIYGFSYENRSVTEEKVKEYKMKNTKIPFHIATLHGSIRSNTEHDMYAPFQLSDLLEEDFDYWALGHIHKREVLKENPPIVYPGNIQGRNRKESGMKGCYHVELTEVDATLDFIPLQHILYESVEVDVTNCHTLHEVETEIVNVVMNDDRMERSLINLSITGSSILQQWEKNGDLEELVEIINESVTYGSEWKYIYRFSTNVKSEISEADLAQGEHFIGEVIRQADQIDIQESIRELSHHKKARRYAHHLTPEDEEIIIHKAKELLIHELLKG